MAPGHATTLAPWLSLLLLLFASWPAGWRVTGPLGADAADITLFCKCLCAPNATILVVEKCIDCTKAFCVEQGACWWPAVEPSVPIATTILTLPSASTSTTSSETSTTSSTPTVHAALMERRDEKGSCSITQAMEPTRPKSRRDALPVAVAASPTTTTPASTNPVNGSVTLVPVPSSDPGDTWTVTCFQRGSSKDEFFVYSFLTIVTGLLLWILLRPLPTQRHLGDNNISTFGAIKYQADLRNDDQLSFEARVKQCLHVFQRANGPLWTEYLKPRWARQRLRLQGGKQRVFAQFMDRVADEAATENKPGVIA